MNMVGVLVSMLVGVIIFSAGYNTGKQASQEALEVFVQMVENAKTKEENK